MLAAALEVQFVVLQNSKKLDSAQYSEIEKHANHEILRVHNDRYFGSCEENIYRAQDFLDVFHEYVFCVGEHDEIDWPVLCNSLAFFEGNRLDAMGWNILNQQAVGEGRYVNTGSFSPVTQSRSSTYVNMLLAGNTLPASLAFPAILSTYGPIDWAAYLGNHIFRKSVFGRVLQYRFSEHVYSFVFKQAAFFSTSDARYGLYNQCVIHRISSDFLHLKNAGGVRKVTWLEDHRLAHGATPIFSVSNLSHLLDLSNDRLFNLVSNSLCLSHWLDAKFEIEIKYHPFLLCIFSWSRQVILHKLYGKSHYFPGSIRSSYLTDLRHVKRYFEKMLEVFEFNDFAANGQPLKTTVMDLVLGLQAYLDKGIQQDALLVSAVETIQSTMALLKNESIAVANNESFSRYLQGQVLPA
ncbi:MAG: hypothetical protein WCH60_05335 [Burkholderiales bacterium]